ncbi:MAG: hypothetical protein ACO3P9_07675 [Phycisphaerales bacterium]
MTATTTAAPTTHSAPAARSRRSFPWGTAVVVAALAAGGAWLMLSGEGDDGTEPTRSDVHLVESGSFNIVIPVSGEAAAPPPRSVRSRSATSSRVAR